MSGYVAILLSRELLIPRIAYTAYPLVEIRFYWQLNSNMPYSNLAATDLLQLQEAEF